ncbi:MAG TPA: competence protein CoiA family protein [Geodermatophilus sp.]|nr:competence protein CoiA family protein [Geodermatophilus sp.]
MAGELLWAVTDGPAGTNAVGLPEDRVDARRLGLHYGGEFWCSRGAGGCGGRLHLRAGGRLRPYFRHHGDVPCPFLGREADVGRAYEHLRYQRAVEAWIAGQGYRARLEKVPAEDGRTDLHLVVDDVGHAVVVQLSPLPDIAWRERDDRYRTHVRHVTWLYGPAAEAAAATEVAVRGVAFALRRQGVGLVVGVRDVDDHTRWVRLAACRLTADGFAAPGSGEARALHARRTAERQQAARRVAHQAARRPGGRTPAGESGERGTGCAPARTPWAASLRPLPFPG